MGFYLHDNGRPEAYNVLDMQVTKFSSVIARLRDFGFSCARLDMIRLKGILGTRWLISRRDGLFKWGHPHLAESISDLRKARKDRVRRRTKERILFAKKIVDEYNKAPGSTIDEILIRLRH